MNIVVITSIIILYVNIYFLFHKQLKLLYRIKNIDLSIIKNFNSSYINISQNLNHKYIVNKKRNNKYLLYNKYEKKEIELLFIDFLNSKIQNCFINNFIKILKLKFIVIIQPNNPTYLIYNVFGCEHLKEKYNNTIKIAFYLENQIPDFNKADYGIGQAHLNFIDRYFKSPFFLIFDFNNNMFRNIRNKVINNTKRKKFCASVISNVKSSNGFRMNFIIQLNKYKKVDMGGHYHNNVGYIKDKIKFFSSYKFSIAMENSEGDGYLSEKIFDSFISGTIPIYYGDYMVDEYINPKSFILIRGKKDIFEKIELIKKIDNNDKFYKLLLKEDVFINRNFRNKIINEKINFLFNIFNQEKSMAKRIDNYHFK